VKPDTRREPDLVMTPESAVWLLYAGLVQGIRWRRHLAASPRPLAQSAPQRLRGPAPR
jgi:hypothetical protein